MWGVAIDMPYILWCEIEGMSGIIKTLILLGYFLIGGGLENAAKRALQASGKFIPWQVVTVTLDGRLKEE